MPGQSGFKGFLYRHTPYRYIRDILDEEKDAAEGYAWTDPDQKNNLAPRSHNAPTRNELSRAMVEVNKRRKANNLPQLPFRYRTPYRPKYGSFGDFTQKIQDTQRRNPQKKLLERPYTAYGNGTMHYHPDNVGDYAFRPKGSNQFYRVNREVLPSVRQNEELAKRLKYTTNLAVPERVRISPSINYDEVMAIQSADPSYPTMAKLHGQYIPEPFLWSIDKSRQPYKDYLKSFGSRFTRFPSFTYQGPPQRVLTHKSTNLFGDDEFDGIPMRVGDAFYVPRKRTVGYGIRRLGDDFFAARAAREYAGIQGGVDPSTAEYNSGVYFSPEAAVGKSLGHELTHANQAVDADYWARQSTVPWLQPSGKSPYPRMGGSPTSYTSDGRNLASFGSGYGIAGKDGLDKFIYKDPKRLDDFVSNYALHRYLSRGDEYLSETRLPEKEKAALKHAGKVLSYLKFDNDDYAKSADELSQSAAAFNRRLHALKQAVSSDIRPYVSAGYDPNKLDQLLKLPTFLPADNKGKMAFEERLKFFRDNPEFGKLLGFEGNRFPSSYWGMHAKMLENRKALETATDPEDVDLRTRAADAAEYLLGQMLNHRVIY